MKERKDQNEKIKELTEKLQAGIQELHDSEKYRDYLRTMAKFHHYSFNNSLLIWAQTRCYSSCRVQSMANQVWAHRQSWGKGHYDLRTIQLQENAARGCNRRRR